MEKDKDPETKKLVKKCKEILRKDIRKNKMKKHHSDFREKKFTEFPKSNKKSSNTK